MCIRDSKSPEQAEAVANYKHQASLKSDLARTDLAKEKTGVWTGAYAINPVNGREIPIWIAAVSYTHLRRFWRRYHIGKILFILVAVLVLTVGSYLFYIAKTTNVSDLQDVYKRQSFMCLKYDKN